MLLVFQNSNFEQTPFTVLNSGRSSFRLSVDLNSGMFCNIENCFYSLAYFYGEYLGTQNLESFIFPIKRHVSADTVLTSGCDQF